MHQDDAAWISRRVRAPLTEAMRDTRVVFLMGARQTGKTTLVRDILKHDLDADFVTLDDKTTREAAIYDPTGFIAGASTPMVIDEVQRSPDLLLAIKQHVDEHRAPGQFLLTGSANILTMPRVHEALTGRVELSTLWPLSQDEIRGSRINAVDLLFDSRVPNVEGARIGREAYSEIAVGGGYPEARLRVGRRRARWFQSYLKTLIERDFVGLADAERLDDVPRLLRVLASQTANLFNQRNIARTIGLDHKTVKSYVALLETLFIVRRLPAWRPGFRSREIHAPKLLFVDTGLACYLMGADERRVRKDVQVAGKILENFCAMEVTKYLEWSEAHARLFHYRFGDTEIDLVIENMNGDLVAIETKAAASLIRKDWSALASLRDAARDRFSMGVLIYTGAKTIPLSDRIWAVPLEGLLGTARHG